MNSKIIQFLAKNVRFRKWLLSRLRKKWGLQKPENIKHEYVSKLLEYVDIDEVEKIYTPMQHGQIKLTMHCKNVEDLVEKCSSIADAIFNDKNINPIKQGMRTISIDGFFSDNKDVPIEMKNLSLIIIPEIKRLCRVLEERRGHESVGYFQRSSCKILHDAKCLIEALADITD